MLEPRSFWFIIIAFDSLFLVKKIFLSKGVVLFSLYSNNGIPHSSWSNSSWPQR
ncbi:MAG: hypothetical protein IKJ03_00880 [Mycoplasmataceae bacterium]|nr:hypothetical protein [Mycoplasmataceae bacterium]